MTLGEKLQQLRKQKGLSQEQLALKLTVSRQSISKWELDSSFPDTENIVKISNIFDVSTDYLLKEDAKQTDLSTPAQIPATQLQRGRFAHLMMLGGGIGILAFWILSSVFPAVTSFAEASANGDEARTIVKTGLPAFLEINHVELLFILCCVAFAAGIAMEIVSLVKAKAKREK